MVAQVAKMDLSGAGMEEMWISPTNTMWVLAAVDIEEFSKKVGQMSQLNEQVRQDIVERDYHDIGIAIGGGTDVAVESADLVLVKSNPMDIVKVLRLSGASYQKQLQNVWWGAGYNIVMIPLAAGILAPWGIVMPPAVGAILMSISTIIVAANAQLLRRVDLSAP